MNVLRIEENNKEYKISESNSSEDQDTYKAKKLRNSVKFINSILNCKTNIPLEFFNRKTKLKDIEFMKHDLKNRERSRSIDSKHLKNLEINNNKKMFFNINSQNKENNINSYNNQLYIKYNHINYNSELIYKNYKEKKIISRDINKENKENKKNNNLNLPINFNSLQEKLFNKTTFNIKKEYENKKMINLSLKDNIDKLYKNLNNNTNNVENNFLKSDFTIEKSISFLIVNNCILKLDDILSKNTNLFKNLSESKIDTK